MFERRVRLTQSTSFYHFRVFERFLVIFAAALISLPAACRPCAWQAGLLTFLIKQVSKARPARTSPPLGDQGFVLHKMKLRIFPV
jgi:hypothetical protein